MNKLCIIDLETTGLDPSVNEIIEIAAVLLDPRTFAIESVFEVKVKPDRPEDGHPKAYAVNGYNAEEWEDGMTLYQAMMQLCQWVPQGTVMMAYNLSFDYGFLQAAERVTSFVLPFSHSRIDLLTLAWGKIPHHKVFSWSLKTVCTYLGIPPEPKMHRALNGAMAEYEVYKALMTESV